MRLQTEFERNEEWVGERARGRDVFGHLMICVADTATEDDDGGGGGQAQAAVLSVEDGAAFDAAFRHSYLGGGGGDTTESGHATRNS